jgi:hypothetical protein
MDTSQGNSCVCPFSENREWRTKALTVVECDKPQYSCRQPRRTGISIVAPVHLGYLILSNVAVRF